MGYDYTHLWQKKVLVGCNNTEKPEEPPQYDLKNCFQKYNEYNIPKSISQRKRTIKNIKDNEILTFVALNDPNNEIRQIAIKGINDDDVLFDIVMSSNDSTVCLEAIKYINDDNVLVKIFKSAPDYNMRYVAIEYIKDSDILLDISKNDSFALLKVVRHMDDKYILEDMLQKCDDKIIRSKISDRINFLREMKKSKKIENGFEEEFQKHNQKLEEEFQKHNRQLEENERKRRQELFHARNRF